MVGRGTPCASRMPETITIVAVSMGSAARTEYPYPLGRECHGGSGELHLAESWASGHYAKRRSLARPPLRISAYQDFRPQAAFLAVAAAAIQSC